MTLRSWRKSSLPDPSLKKSTKRVGDSGEEKAGRFLESQNYQIISKNWRTRHGEIDIIALECRKDADDILVFAEELNRRKQKRIIETAKFFLTKHRQYNNSKIRFDVLVIDMPDFPPVYHIKNAFSEFV